MMKSYLDIASRYLSAHRKRTGYALLSVIMAVALVTGIFSMLDYMVRYERQQILKDEGNYHIYVKKPSQQETDFIRNRLEVKATGHLKDFGKGKLNNTDSALMALNESFSTNLNVILTEGRYPVDEDEVMLEKWTMEREMPALKIGDTVRVTAADSKEMSFKISGICEDWGETKAAAIPFVFMSMKASEKMTPETDDFFILFKDGVNIHNTGAVIAKTLNISPERIIKNERLLALMLQTKNNRVLQFYAIGAALFALVLITAVVMIYNTFNISVMERIRNFGLLRCIGASKTQIKSLLRREASITAVVAIPPGILAGMMMTVICSAVLKYFNSSIYGDINLFNISAMGIGLGAIIGFLTVFIASMLPARRASKVSAINAVTGSNEIKVSKAKKRGVLTHLFHVEMALGITNAVNKKKTLILMSLSIAFSIIMFLGFNVLMNPANLGVREIKASAPDITISSDKGIPGDIYEKIADLKGIKRIYGRKTSLIKVNMGSSENSFENSRFVSYDGIQLKWAKGYMTSGSNDEEYLNLHSGVILVLDRNNANMQSKIPELGTKITVETGKGLKELYIKGIMKAPSGYSDESTDITLITSEKIFSEITQDTEYKSLDIQLKNKKDEQIVSEIRGIAGNTLTFHDIRQLNAKARSSFLTMAVFIYGFVGVIALISILNIINTMNTSVAAKTKNFGVMRAIGMSGRQLSVMVLAEAAVYSLAGCMAGCIFGIMLQRTMVGIIIDEWEFPLLQVVMIFAVCIVTASLSVLGPLKKIKAKSIYDTIGTL